MDGITGKALVLACSAIGAGLAMIAGIGSGKTQKSGRIDKTKECDGFKYFFFA